MIILHRSLFIENSTFDINFWLVLQYLFNQRIKDIFLIIWKWWYWPCVGYLSLDSVVNNIVSWDKACAIFPRYLIFWLAYSYQFQWSGRFIFHDRTKIRSLGVFFKYYKHIGALDLNGNYVCYFLSIIM